MDDEEEDDEEEKPAQSEPIVIEDEPMSIFKEGIKFPTNVNGSDVRVGIIMARWNGDVIQGLYKGVNESLTACGVQPNNVFTTYVPGAFEMPITAKFLAASKRVDVVICLGCLIKGDTMHFEYIAQATASGIMQVGLESLVPCIFGVLTVLNKQQAIDRSTGSHNEGLSWGKTAVEMGLARMSALGMGKMKLKDDVTEASKFVTFNSTITPKDDKKEKKRTFF
jgi:6,7-dimethyl-8-ribityllumazine synthase